MINAAKLKAAAQGFNALFKEALAQSPASWQRIAMETRSTGASEKYLWIDDVPGLKRFVGERVAKQLSANDLIIVNETWEDTIAVPRAVIEDDSLGIVRPRIVSMGEAAGVHYDELCFGLLSRGFTSLAYDKLPFYADRGSYNNSSTAPLTGETYALARKNILSRRNEEGRPLGLNPDLLVTGPALEATGREILMAERDATGATNIWRGTAEHLVVPWIESETEWHLLCTTRAYKPLIMQIRVAPEFEAHEQNSEKGFTNLLFHYGIYARHNAGFGLPQLAYGSTGIG